MSDNVVTLATHTVRKSGAKAYLETKAGYVPAIYWLVTPSPHWLAKGHKAELFTEAKIAYLVALDCCGTVQPVELIQ